MVFKHCVMTSSLTIFMLINFAQSASAMYDPMLGRFASRDPIGYEDGVGLYRANFALEYVDPTGESSVPIGAVIFSYCTLGVVLVEGPPLLYCMTTLTKLQKEGKLKDPNRFETHCFLNCCMTKLNLGLPFFTIAFSCKEPFEFTHGDCIGDVELNIYGYFTAIDQLFISDPYDQAGDCVSRCDGLVAPPTPPKPKKLPVIPRNGPRDGEYFLCEKDCRMKTMQAFPGPSPEADAFYFRCLDTQCKGLIQW